MSSIVSALLNVFLFQSLDPVSFKWLLISISITLELTKMSTIVSRNIFRSIYSKAQKKRIKFAQHFFLVVYLLLGVLSITAGLGFSLVITSRTAAVRSADFTLIETKIEEMTDLNNRINSYIMARELSIHEWPPYMQSLQTFQEREALWQEAEDRVARVVAERNRIQAQLRTMNDENPQWQRLQNELTLIQGEVNAATTERSSFNTSLTRARQDLLNRQSEYNLAREDAGTRIAELNEEFVIMVAGLNLTSSTPRLALIELQEQHAALERLAIEEKGMAYMFDQFALYLNTTPEMVKLWILLFVAFLIELTIYQTAPDIHITRRVLYFFRTFIPTDVNVDKLLKEFDNEIDRFTEDYVPDRERDKKKTTHRIVYEDLDDEPDPEPKPVKKTLLAKPEKKIIIPKTTTQPPLVYEEEELNPIEKAIMEAPQPIVNESVAQKIIEHIQSQPTVKPELAAQTEELIKEYENEASKETYVEKLVEEKITFNDPTKITIAREETPIIVSPDSSFVEIPKVVPEPPKTVVVEAVRKVKRPDAGEHIDDIAPTTDNGGPVHVKINPVPPTTHSINQDQVVNYRFGKTTSKFKDKLILFIEELYRAVQTEKKPYTLNSLDEIVDRLGLTQKTCNVFVKRLCEMRLEGSPLMYFRDGKLCSTFEKDLLINYTTEVIEPKNAST